MRKIYLPAQLHISIQIHSDKTSSVPICYIRRAFLYTLHLLTARGAENGSNSSTRAARRSLGHCVEEEWDQQGGPLSGAKVGERARHKQSKQPIQPPSGVREQEKVHTLAK